MVTISFPMLMTEALQNWNSFEVFKAVIGPLFAAIFVVIGICLKEWYDRRKAVQSWYEQYYITEGLDVLISYFSALRSELVNALFALFSRPTCPDRLPFQVRARVQTLLNENAFNGAYDISLNLTQDVLEDIEASKDGMPSDLNKQKINVLLSVVSKLNDGLQSVRKELLQTGVTDKAQIYGIAKRKEINDLVAACKDELMKGMGEIMKIYELETRQPKTIGRQKDQP
jgi:hypothetical protein